MLIKKYGCLPYRHQKKTYNATKFQKKNEYYFITYYILNYLYVLLTDLMQTQKLKRKVLLHQKTYNTISLQNKLNDKFQQAYLIAELCIMLSGELVLPHTVHTSLLLSLKILWVSLVVSRVCICNFTSFIENNRKSVMPLV